LRPKLIAVFLLIVLVPLGLITWLAVRTARNERTVIEHKLRELLMVSLRDAERAVVGVVQERERELLQLTGAADPRDAEQIRSLVRRNPFVSQVFVMGPDGERVHPPLAGSLTDSERGLIERHSRLQTDPQGFYRDVLAQSAALTDGGGEAAAPRILAEGHRTGAGWYVVTTDGVPRVVFWQVNPAGLLVGAELNCPRLQSDVAGRLPATDPFRPEIPHGRITLRDSAGSILYQWGSYEPLEGELPRASLPVRPPLDFWALDYYLSSADLDKALGGGVRFSLFVSLVVGGLALVALSVYFYRESSRTLREAAQRTGFVNRVSHELRTPLTNIRMYAEMLEDGLPEDDGQARQQLGVILSESRRLSRLITNVLTFARKQKDTLKLHRMPVCVDEIVSSSIEHFRPALERKGIKVVFSLGASGPVSADTDAVEQILANLFSNVEKHAADGGLMEVTSQRQGGRTVITVSDRGPGIPKDMREKVFQPFYRCSDRLSEAVTGTGIGLSISRDLARLHGGDLTIMPAEVGTTFRVELDTPHCDSGEKA